MTKFKILFKHISLVLLLLPIYIFSQEINNFNNNEVIPLVSFDNIPDSSEIRKLNAKKWLLDSPKNIIKEITKIEADNKGNKFKVKPQYLEDKNLLAVFISPVNTEFSSSNKVPQGSWVLYRNFETGEPVSIKIFPRENPELYLELKPENKNYTEGRTLVNICLFNAFVRKEIAIGIPFNSLYYLSLLELKENTKMILPWEIFDPPISFNGVEVASDIIRERLYKLVYIEDGAFDEFENPIHLKTGKAQAYHEIVANIKPSQKLSEVVGGVNCSGFAKWIVDGIIRPIAGQGTFLKSLVTKTNIPDTYFTKPYEYKQLYFGLEWIRNLASAVLSLNLKRTVLPIKAGVDVTVEPFALVPPRNEKKDSSKFVAFKGYEKNAGYQTDYLQALLYYLAITEPGHFYLGAVSRDMGTPKLRQYHHIVAFFPYFDLFGNFHIDVFESAAETSIELFMQRNTDAFTALVRVRAPQLGLFNP